MNKETLEEAAQKKYPIKNTGTLLERFGLNYVANQKFIEGAKWHQERSYSEEEVKKISLDFFYYWWNTKGNSTEEGFNKWFEQFKKK